MCKGILGYDIQQKLFFSPAPFLFLRQFGAYIGAIERRQAKSKRSDFLHFPSWYSIWFCQSSVFLPHIRFYVKRLYVPIDMTHKVEIPKSSVKDLSNSIYLSRKSHKYHDRLYFVNSLVDLGYFFSKNCRV